MGKQTSNRDLEGLPSGHDDVAPCLVPATSFR